LVEGVPQNSSSRCLKPIKAGEEIYVHYGEDYWIKKAEWEAKLSSTVVELNCMD